MKSFEFRVSSFEFQVSSSGLNGSGLRQDAVHHKPLHLKRTLET